MPDVLTHSAKAAPGLDESGVSRWFKDSYGPALSVAGTLAMGAIAIKFPSEIPILSRESPQVTRVAAEGLGTAVSELYGRVSQSIARLEGITGVGETAHRSAGTAFAVSEFGKFNGKLLTAAHEVRGRIDKWVVDQAGSVHEVRVLDSDFHNDLTVLQLKNQSSLGAFNPIPVRKPERFLNPNELRVFGHPEFSNEVVMSTGYNHAVPYELKFFPDRVIVPMELRHGISGGPLVNTKAEAIAITSEMATNNGRTFFLGPPGQIADRLLWSTRQFEAPGAPVLTDTLQWAVADQSAAAESLAKFWQRPITARPEVNQLHARFHPFDIEGNLLTTRASFNFGDNVVSIRPNSLNGGQLPGDATYGHTKIKEAELHIHLDDQLRPVSVVSNNDPAGLLPRLFREELPFVQNPSA